MMHEYTCHHWFKGFERATASETAIQYHEGSGDRCSQTVSIGAVMAIGQILDSKYLTGMLKKDL